MPYNDFGVTTFASKRARRKGRYLKGFSRWASVHKETRKRAARAVRRDSQVHLTVPGGGSRPTPDQGKRPVASHRCGNGCGRDYLCPRCRA